MSDVLISPLGRSPGAVSGVYFALREKGFNIDRVVTVGTSHPVVIRASQDFLSRLFAALDVEYEAIHLEGLDFTSERKIVMLHTRRMGVEIERARAAGGQVHISVTGGRSGMGALAALAAQFYGASHLWHLSVPLEIEKMGDTEQLAGLISTSDFLASPALNPTLAGEQAYSLVSLPFSDFSGIKSLLTYYAQFGKLPDAASVAMLAFIKDAGLSVDMLRQVYPAGASFEDLDDYFRLVERYWQANEAHTRESILMEIGAWMERTGILAPEDRERLTLLLHANGSADELLQMVKKDPTGIWAYIKKIWNSIKNNKDQLDVLMKASDLFLKLGDFYLKYKASTLILPPVP
jgi:hypothetical protein